MIPKYNFKTATGNRTLDRLEFWVSSMEDVSKQEYFDFASKMLNQEENIDSISYNFILVDNTNQAEEEKELFNSKYLVSKTLVEFDFVAGYNYGKFEDNVENTEYLSSLMQYNFEFM